MKYITCSYLQIIILFSLTILPFHRNTLSKIVFSSSLWFVPQIPAQDEINGKHVSGPPRDPRPSRVVLSMEAIIILMNMLDAHLQRKLSSEKIFPLFTCTHQLAPKRVSHTQKCPWSYFQRNNNSTRGYQIKTLSQTWSELKELQCQGSHTYFFTKFRQVQ